MTAEHTSRCYCNCLACNAGRYDGNGHTSCACLDTAIAPPGGDRIEDGMWVDVHGDPTCWACRGEECWRCGPHPEGCEHDVTERHNGEHCRDIPAPTSTSPAGGAS